MCTNRCVIISVLWPGFKITQVVVSSAFITPIGTSKIQSVIISAIFDDVIIDGGHLGLVDDDDIVNPPSLVTSSLTAAILDWLMMTTL